MSAIIIAIESKGKSHQFVEFATCAQTARSFLQFGSQACKSPEQKIIVSGTDFRRAGESEDALVNAMRLQFHVM
jgi:hypothetical protein